MADSIKPRQGFEAESQEKLTRLGRWLEHSNLDGVMLWLRGNFAWITCGGDNHIANNSPVGVAGIFATREQRVCFTSNIESPRIRAEELSPRRIEVVDAPWWDMDAQRRAAREIIAGRKFAADVDALGLGLPGLPSGFDELRWSLTAPEVERYRDGARHASAAMEGACRELRAGMSEHDVAGVLDHHVHAAGCNPVVTLVAADERIERFRHPIPTNHRLQRYVMLVTCAESAGLISNLTRFVHFGPIPDELKRRQQSVANIDAAVNLSTKPGRTLGEVFEDLRRAYADEGFADEWQLHHQGGSTGYNPRDAVAGPGHRATVRESQAFAWNPSITGAKSEDTVLVTSGGIEVLTKHASDWPTIRGKSRVGELDRAGVMIA